MSIICTDEAAVISGLSPFTIRKLCRDGAFEANQLAGRQGGWRIGRQSFLIWLALRKRDTGNAIAKRQAIKDLQRLGAA